MSPLKSTKTSGILPVHNGHNGTERSERRGQNSGEKTGKNREKRGENSRKTSGKGDPQPQEILENSGGQIPALSHPEKFPQIHLGKKKKWDHSKTLGDLIEKNPKRIGIAGVFWEFSPQKKFREISSFCREFPEKTKFNGILFFSQEIPKKSNRILSVFLGIPRKKKIQLNSLLLPRKKNPTKFSPFPRKSLKNPTKFPLFSGNSQK